MYEDQNIITIEPAQMIEKAAVLKEQGYRLVQMCCNTMGDTFELSYTFDKNLKMTNFRMVIPQEMEIMSISHIFPPAFLYENEMKDLFGVKITHITVDFNGTLYKLSVPTPFNPPKEKPVEEAPVEVKEEAPVETVAATPTDEKSEEEA